MDDGRFTDLIDRLSAQENESAKSIYLTANENALSALATKFLAGALYGRYNLGHGNKRDDARYAAEFSGLVFKSLPVTYEMEREAADACRRMFRAEFVDFRPLSGVHAIISTLAALTAQGDHLYCLRPDEGGITRPQRS